MQRAFDLIKQRLEEYRASSEDDYHGLGCEDDFGAMNAYGHAIEIVNQVASEYGGGWIPVSSGKLPDLGQKVIVTDKDGMVYYNVSYGCIDEKTAEPSFHQWVEAEWTTFTFDVVAWRYELEPYKAESE